MDVNRFNFKTEPGILVIYLSNLYLCTTFYVVLLYFNVGIKPATSVTNITKLN